MTTDDHRADPTGAVPTPAPQPASTAPAPQPPSTDSSPGEVPDEGTLAAIATPAAVRRAPRIGAFIRAGVLLGAVVGWLLAILYSGTTEEGRMGVILLTTAAGAGLGALVGAGVAALVDRRSARPAGRARRRGTR